MLARPSLGSSIEPYDERYADDIASLIQQFHHEALSEYVGEISPDAILQTIRDADKRNVFLFVADDHAQGLLYGVRTKSTTGEGDIWQEVIWYVTPTYRRSGISLLQYAEKALKESGVSLMIMVALANSKTEKLHRFYERLGYRPMETHFSRRLV